MTAGRFGQFLGKMKGLWLCLLLTCLPAAVVWAEEPLQAEATFRIAVVNVNELMQGAPQARAASEKLKADYQGEEQRLAEEQKLIAQQTDDLEHQTEAGTLSNADRLRMERDLRSSERAYNRKMEDFRDQVRAAREAAMSSLQDLIFGAIEEVRAQEQIDLVLKEGDYIAASKRVDMTGKVLQNLEMKDRTAKTQNKPTQE